MGTTSKIKRKISWYFIYTLYTLTLLLPPAACLMAGERPGTTSIASLQPWGLTPLTLGFISLIVMGVLILSFYSIYTLKINALNLQFNNHMQQQETLLVNHEKSKESLVSEIISYREQIKKLEERSDQAEFARTAFLAAMSYEMRNPLNTLFATSVMLSQTTLTDEQKEHLQILQASGSALVKIIDDLTDFSRIETGKLTLNPVKFNLCDTIRDVIKVFEKKCAEKSLTLYHKIDENVPERITSDQLRLKQILMNLINKSITQTQNGESIIIEVKSDLVDKNHHQIKFLIRDTGMGMNEENALRMFNAFSCIDYSATSEYGGTGFGFHDIDRLTALLGGELSAEVERGNGTIFSFSIKAESYNDEQIEAGTKHQNATAQEILPGLSTDFAQQYPLNILVAEDNPLNQKLFTRILNKLGYNVQVVDTGLQVLEALNKTTYDLVFMDVQMPRMNGMEATMQIRRKYGTHPIVVAVTANAMEGDKDDCLESGMNDYISKPYGIDVLMEVLKKWHAVIHA